MVTVKEMREDVMAIIKCKMCGGDLILTEGSAVAECEYCGSLQTVPSADSEKKLHLFTRAERLWANSEFDKAAGVYESIVADFPEEAEAYWGLILCRYGIEYVDDPATGKKIPTCHRSSFNSVMDDQNFELVMEYADPIARRIYREEAKQIEELRKGIIDVSSHEAPYDIFICYKETDENGHRTLDSVLAQDAFDMLTENGYRVFFSRVSLEDKLGAEYEPYIFAALNSAKIMLAFGTDYDYYNAVWVKNEWSRFLQLIARGEKKTLIPCFKNIDAYDMPKEFARLQALDLGRIGAMQDLLRGVRKILPKSDTGATVIANPQETQSAELTYKKEVSEKVRRRNGTKMIKYLQVIGSTSDVGFPEGQPSTKIDLFLFPYLSMQMFLWKRIGYSGTAVFNFSVFNSRDEWITNLTTEINVLPQYDRLAKVLILKGSDGSRMELGRYRLEAWINDSCVEEMYFELIDTTEERKAYAQNQIAAIWQRQQAAQNELNNLRGVLAGRRRKELEAELAVLERNKTDLQRQLASMG